MTTGSREAHEAVQVVLQKFGVAVGCLWAVGVGVCWNSAANLDEWAEMVGSLTAAAFLWLLLGGLIVRLWFWTIQPQHTHVRTGLLKGLRWFLISVALLMAYAYMRGCTTGFVEGFKEAWSSAQ